MISGWKKAIVLLAIYLIAILGIGFFITYPAIKQIQKNKASLFSKQKQLKELYAKVDTLEKINKDPEAFGLIYNTVQGYWPDNQDVSSFMIQTEGMAESKQVVMENFSVTQTTADKKNEAGKKSAINKSNLGFSFSVKSGYPTILSIVQSMETLARYNSIKSINFNLTGDSTVSTVITGNVYYGK